MFYDANIGKDGEKGRTCSGRGESTDYTNFTKIKIRVLRVIRWPKTKKRLRGRCLPFAHTQVIGMFGVPGLFGEDHASHAV